MSLDLMDPPSIADPIDATSERYEPTLRFRELRVARAALHAVRESRFKEVVTAASCRTGIAWADCLYGNRSGRRRRADRPRCGLPLPRARRSPDRRGGRRRRGAGADREGGAQPRPPRRDAPPPD